MSIPSASNARAGAGSRWRAMAFTAVVVISVAGAFGYAAWRTRAAEPAASPVRTDGLLASLPDAPGAANRPYVVFRNASTDQTHGRVGLRFIDAPDGERYLTPLSCERVHLGAGRGICLQAVRGMLTSYHARIFDRHFHIEHSQALTGPPSRARISPDGRLAAITVFENGHSYASTQFSTRTSILDTATGQWVVDDLEKWDVRRGGKPLKAADFNYWGITFARDGHRFYTTLHTAGQFHLVEGDLATRAMRVIHDDVECPSLSPDNTRIAFKRRAPTGAAGRFAWRLVVLDLASGRETLLAGETRSVDDQVEWLDDEHIAYALPDRDDESTAAMNIWALDTSGTATPRLLVPMASSPAAALARGARPAP